jgi:group II intron reverse transcriptase/maturase
MYPRVSWVVEGDIVGCFDNIPHNGLLKAVARRIADGKVLSLVSAFLKAGYMENWQYHKTYSGTPQGGILSPFLCNIFLHQLDEYMESLGANKVQTSKEKDWRRNPAYVGYQGKILRIGAKLRQAPTRETRTALLKELLELKRKRRHIPYYDAPHQTKLGYVRYADDFVILVNGTEEDARDIKNRVEDQLTGIGLKLSVEKTRMTHWDKPITFLGYHIHGELRDRGVQIKAILTIPKEKERQIRRELLRVASYHHIPELDAMMSMNAKIRGWSNYYKYANSPQVVFNRVAHKMWWFYAHFLAQKHRMSIKTRTVRPNLEVNPRLR